MKIPFAFWGQAESELPIVGGVKVLNTDLTEAEIQYTLIDEGKNGPVWSYGIVYSKLFPNVTLDTPGAQVKALGNAWPSNLPVTNTDIITGLDDTSTYYFRVFATNGPSGVQPTAENTFYSNTATGETAWNAFTFEYRYNDFVQQVPGDQVILGRVYADAGTSGHAYNLLNNGSQQITVDKALGTNAVKWKVEDENTGNLITQGNFTNSGGFAEIKIDKSLIPTSAPEPKIIVTIAHDDTVPNSTFNNFRIWEEGRFAEIRIRRWGPAKWKKWDFMFMGSNDSSKNPANTDPTIGTPADTPDLSECISWQGAFRFNQRAWSGDTPNEQKLGEYDLSNIKVAMDTFRDSNVCGLSTSATTKPLKDANWENCQIFDNCFSSNNVLNSNAMDNLDLSGWTFNQTDNINMFAMFDGNRLSINTIGQPGLANWDVGKVINFESFLSSAQYWDEDLGSWDVSECLNMARMFAGATNANFDASNWVVAQIQDYTAFSDNVSGWVLPQPPFPFIATNANIQQAVNDVLAVDPTGTTAVAPYPLIGEWNTSQVTDMSELFRFKQQFNADISTWDVSNVTTMRQMFETCSNYNQPLNTWDTSSLTNIYLMFHNCYVFNQPLNNWNVSGVSGTNGTHVFRYCEAFNQDLDQWDVSNFTSFEDFFFRAKAFNGDVTNWDVSSATTMKSMFQIAHAFNRDISGWDVSNVEDMERMFSSALSFNQPIGGWNVSSVTNMSNMFRDAYDFNQSINSWNVSNVTNMQAMFAAFNNYSGQGPGTFNQPLDQWDVSNVTDMSNMFHTQSTFDQDISGWDISSLTGNGMQGMFSNGVFNQPLNGWTLPSGVTSLENMFSRSDYNQPLDNWDVSGITNMRLLFWNAEFNQDISGWDVSNLTSMQAMFMGDQCKFNQPIGNWDTSSVNDMESMFYGNIIFDQDISTWPTTTPVSVDKMFRESTYNRPLPNWKIDGTDGNAMRDTFRDNTNFNQDISGWDVSDVIGFTSTFRNATAFNQDLSSWDVGGATGFSGTFNGATSYDQSFNGWQFERNETYGLGGFNFLAGVTLSTANYDDTLVGWASMMQTLYPNGAGSGAGQFKGSSTFNFGNSVHSTGGPAEAGKNTLINTYNFTITDGNP